jgi:hypothetical protein
MISATNVKKWKHAGMHLIAGGVATPVPKAMLTPIVVLVAKAHPRVRKPEGEGKKRKQVVSRSGRPPTAPVLVLHRRAAQRQ